MINPNELRIGNYIQIERHKNTVRVVGISAYNEPAPSDYVIQYSSPEGYKSSINIDGIAPIPLSPEWLQKFGFTKEADPDSDFEEIWQNEIIDRISKRGGKYRFHIEALYGPDVEIKSVHHLQNVYFALTSTELEINTL